PSARAFSGGFQAGAPCVQRLFRPAAASWCCQEAPRQRRTPMRTTTISSPRPTISSACCWRRCRRMWGPKNRRLRADDATGGERAERLGLLEGGVELEYGRGPELTLRELVAHVRVDVRVGNVDEALDVGPVLF